jgi:hypothetical protein
MAALMKKNQTAAEFGDFQTPVRLAKDACSVLNRLGVSPKSIVEPTCGIGRFLIAALEQFPESEHALGLDINPNYVAAATEWLAGTSHAQKVSLECGSFFSASWPDLFAKLPEPILIVGNPPWVTNAHLGVLGSDNLPTKSNFQNQNGFDALTGKSNFDISEWMLIHLLTWLQNKRATVAMLCKTAVARKVFFHAWKTGMPIQDASIFLVDAAAHFGAAVDACFLVCSLAEGHASYDCRVYGTLKDTSPIHHFGYRDGHLIADVERYDKWKHLQGVERYRWRSGVKHDCSSIMELRRIGADFQNGLGEHVQLEAQYLYPMLKSSDVAKGNVRTTRRWMLVPQSSTGAETYFIEFNAPHVWAYLQRHAHLLDRRGSSIYRKRPRFSIFGVGDYTFAPWKVAISGFYKSLQFRAVGPIDGRPTVFDDTVNFIPCETQEEAQLMADLLNSPIAAEFFEAFIFWDAKRPVTVDLLRRVDLLALAKATGMLAAAQRFIPTLDGVKRHRIISSSAQADSVLPFDVDRLSEAGT